MTDAPEMTFTVELPIGDTGDMLSIGRVSIGSTGRLTLLNANEGFQSALENAIQEANSLEEFRIKAPPPEDAPPMSLYFRTVKRDDSDLVDALCDFLSQNYNLILEAESPFMFVDPNQ